MLSPERFYVEHFPVIFANRSNGKSCILLPHFLIIFTNRSNGKSYRG